MVLITMVSSVALLAFAAASQAFSTDYVQQRGLLQRDLLDDDLSLLQQRLLIRSFLNEAFEARSLAQGASWQRSGLRKRVTIPPKAPMPSNTALTIPRKPINKPPAQQNAVSSASGSKAPASVPKAATGNSAPPPAAKQKPTLPKLDTSVGLTPGGSSTGGPKTLPTANKPQPPRLNMNVGGPAGPQTNSPRPQTPTTAGAGSNAPGGTPPRRNSGLSSTTSQQRPPSSAAVSPQSPNSGNNNWWKKVKDQMAQKPLDSAIKIGTSAAGYGATGAAAGAIAVAAHAKTGPAAIGAGAASLAAGLFTGSSGVLGALNTAKNDQQDIRDKDREQGRNPGQAGSKWAAAQPWNAVKSWVTGNPRTRTPDASSMARRSLYLDENEDALYHMLEARGYFDMDDSYEDIWM